MALFHDATITPTKAELLADWVPQQVWCPDAENPVEVVGAYRFDDPEGQVGMEVHLVSRGDTILQVPLTYRAEPVAGAERALICEMEHSTLGNRWIYDGLGDDRFLIMMASVTMTGQGEALGLFEYDDRWFIAPANVRISGGGWTRKRVPVDRFEPWPAGEGDDEVGTANVKAAVFRNDQFELIVHRRLHPGSKPPIGLTATWDGQADPMVLSEIRER